MPIRLSDSVTFQPKLFVKRDPRGKRKKNEENLYFVQNLKRRFKLFMKTAKQILHARRSVEKVFRFQNKTKCES